MNEFLAGTRAHLHKYDHLMLSVQKVKMASRNAGDQRTRDSASYRLPYSAISPHNVRHLLKAAARHHYISRSSPLTCPGPTGKSVRHFTRWENSQFDPSILRVRLSSEHASVSQPYISTHSSSSDNLRSSLIFVSHVFALNLCSIN